LRCAVSALAGGVERGWSLAALIDRLAGAHEVRDERFARGLATALHAEADHISLPEVDAMGLSDVIVTLYMDKEMRLVITGGLGESGGEAALRWREDDFSKIAMTLHTEKRADPYLFATLDFSLRGRRAELTADIAPGRAGDEVIIRCLATLGDDLHYRVRWGDRELSVIPSALNFESPS